MRYVVDLVIYGLQCVMVVGLTWFRIVLVAMCVCLEWWLLFVGVAWAFGLFSCACFCWLFGLVLCLWVCVCVAGCFVC